MPIFKVEFQVRSTAVVTVEAKDSSIALALAREEFKDKNYKVIDEHIVGNGQAHQFTDATQTQNGLPLPKPGDIVYVPGRCFIDHGEDDTRGGRAHVQGVQEQYGSFFVHVEEVGFHFNWDSLGTPEQQSKMKKEYGKQWAAPDPDYG